MLPLVGKAKKASKANTRPTCPGAAAAAPPPMCHTAFKEQVKVVHLIQAKLLWTLVQEIKVLQNPKSLE
jgi:hypothetical protein